MARTSWYQWPQAGSTDQAQLGTWLKSGWYAKLITNASAARGRVYIDGTEALRDKPIRQELEWKTGVFFMVDWFKDVLQIGLRIDDATTRDLP